MRTSILFGTVATASMVMNPATGLALGLSKVTWSKMSNEQRKSLLEFTQYTGKVIYTTMTKVTDKSFRDTMLDVYKHPKKYTFTMKDVREKLMTKMHSPQFCATFWTTMIAMMGTFGICALSSCCSVLCSMGVLSKVGWFCKGIFALINTLVQTALLAPTVVNATGTAGSLAFMAYITGVEVPPSLKRDVLYLLNKSSTFTNMKGNLSVTLSLMKSLASKLRSTANSAINTLIVMSSGIISYAGMTFVYVTSSYKSFNTMFGYVLYTYGWCNVFDVNEKKVPAEIKDTAALKKTQKEIVSMSKDLKKKGLVSTSKK